jgi:hypothetical protein
LLILPDQYHLEALYEAMLHLVILCFAMLSVTVVQQDDERGKRRANTPGCPAFFALVSSMQSYVIVLKVVAAAFQRG